MGRPLPSGRIRPPRRAQLPAGSACRASAVLGRQRQETLPLAGPDCTPRGKDTGVPDPTRVGFPAGMPGQWPSGTVQCPGAAMTKCHQLGDLKLLFSGLEAASLFPRGRSKESPFQASPQCLVLPVSLV